MMGLFASMDWQWSQLAGMGLLILVSSCLQGIGGIGFAMVSAPVGALLYPQLVPGPLIFLAGVLALLTVLREWEYIVWHVLPAALTGRAAGTVIAAIFLSGLNADHLGIVFALLILLAVLITVMRWSFPSTRISWGIAGIASGVMGTLTSAGAPPLVMVAQHMKPPAMRATMSMVFLVGTVMALGALLLLGRFTQAQWWLSLIMLLPLWLGFTLSTALISHCSPMLTRRLLLGLTSVSALLLLIQSMRSLV
jgi:uncharacterized membrane protein YfcA